MKTFVACLILGFVAVAQCGSLKKAMEEDYGKPKEIAEELLPFDNIDDEKEEREALHEIEKVIKNEIKAIEKKPFKTKSTLAEVVESAYEAAIAAAEAKAIAEGWNDPPPAPAPACTGPKCGGTV